MNKTQKNQKLQETYHKIAVTAIVVMLVDLICIAIAIFDFPNHFFKFDNSHEWLDALYTIVPMLVCPLINIVGLVNLSNLKLEPESKEIPNKYKQTAVLLWTPIIIAVGILLLNILA